MEPHTPPIPIESMPPCLPPSQPPCFYRSCQLLRAWPRGHLSKEALSNYSHSSTWAAEPSAGHKAGVEWVEDVAICSDGPVGAGCLGGLGLKAPRCHPSHCQAAALPGVLSRAPMCSASESDHSLSSQQDTGLWVHLACGGWAGIGD